MTEQGRILAPFMYKIYKNSLLEELSSHSYAVFINSIELTSPTFADDISLLALQPSFLQTFKKICFQYSLKWRYGFNNSKSGVVTFGETKSTHFKSMQDRKWFLGESSVDELYEYKTLGVTKNYVSSFSSDVEENITRKKAGMLFSANINCRRTSPLVYVKFWWQACLPALLFVSELFILTSSQLLKHERGHGF